MNVAKHILIIFGIATLAAVLTWRFHPHVPSYKMGQLSYGEVSLRDALILDSTLPVLWVDAREEADFQANHIPGAILLNEDEWDDLLFEFFNRWDGNQPIIVYCSTESCHSSKQVSERLRETLNVDNIFYLKGGWQAWLEQ